MEGIQVGKYPFKERRRKSTINRFFKIPLLAMFNSFWLNSKWGVADRLLLWIGGFNQLANYDDPLHMIIKFSGKDKSYILPVFRKFVGTKSFLEIWVVTIFNFSIEMCRISDKLMSRSKEKAVTNLLTGRWTDWQTES